MSRWRYRRKSEKKLSWGSFISGMSSTVDELVLDERIATQVYNVRTDRGVIEASSRFDLYGQFTQEEVRLVCDFKNDQGKVFALFFMADSSVIRYELNGYGMPYPATKTVMEGLRYTEAPNVIRYRLHGKNVLLIASSDGRIVVFDGEGYTVHANSIPIKSMTIHNERLFISRRDDANSVWFSDDLDPTGWTVSLDGAGFIELSGDLGAVNEVVSFGGYVYAFRDFGITRIFAEGDQREFSVENLHTSGGRIYGDTVTVCGDRIMFCSNDGVFVFDGYGTQKVMQNVGSYLSFKDGVQGAYRDGKYYFTAIYDYTSTDYEEIDFVGCEGADGYESFELNLMVCYDVFKGSYFIIRGVDISKLCPLRYSKRFLVVEKGNLYVYAQNGSLLTRYKFKAKWRMPQSALGYPGEKKLLKTLSFYCSSNFKIIVSVDGKDYEYEVTSPNGVKSFRSITLNKSGYLVSLTIISNSESFCFAQPTVTFN